jgi:uncharacterized protein (DUF58 family)
MLAGRHDVVALRLVDPRHRSLPDVGLVPWRDPETGALVYVDTCSARVRAAMEARAAERGLALRDLLLRRGVDLVDIAVGASVVEPLVAYLKLRERRLR